MRFSENPPLDLDGLLLVRYVVMFIALVQKYCGQLFYIAMFLFFPRCSTFPFGNIIMVWGIKSNQLSLYATLFAKGNELL
jgi:hypothetical protein